VLQLVSYPVRIFIAVRGSRARQADVFHRNLERSLGVLYRRAVTTGEQQARRCHGSDAGGNNRLASRDAYRCHGGDQTRRWGWKEAKRIGKVDRIPTRIPILIDPTREPDWVALRGVAQRLEATSETRSQRARVADLMGCRWKTFWGHAS